MTLLKLFSVFHLNLAYSSIEEQQRRKVINTCYWPLLEIAEKYRFFPGIELTGYTLQEIERLDPLWVKKLRELYQRKRVEVVSSGYSQLIGPLVPGKVNEVNYFHGNEVYRQLLGDIPKMVLVNEQTFSKGMTSHYIRSGYRSMFMEWNNPFSHHPSWDPLWKYYPQLVRDDIGNELSVVWNDSIGFQKFQRYAHGEFSLGEMREYVGAQVGPPGASLCLYGNDVEVYNFRPGRYQTEVTLDSKKNEWRKIDALLAALIEDDRFLFVLPSTVSQFEQDSLSNHSIDLTCAKIPIPTKKQGKYNVVRWAVTGRDDYRINNVCYQIYEALAELPIEDDRWKELTYLWSSDFRTHITTKRWSTYLHRLNQMVSTVEQQSTRKASCQMREEGEPIGDQETFSISQHGKILEVDCRTMKVRLNTRRGLAIEALTFKEVNNQPLCGTIPHGYYNHIDLGADFYTGHFVLESPGTPKVTDLEPVTVQLLQRRDQLDVFGPVMTPLGVIEKRLTIVPALSKIFIKYDMDFKKMPLGALRLAFVTLLPEQYDRESLFFQTHNGGEMERFSLGNQSVAHGDNVSFLVSAKQAVGMTEKKLWIGDKHHAICLEAEQNSAALIGQIQYSPLRDTFLYRAALSMRELDETSRQSKEKEVGYQVRVALSAILM